MCKYKTHVYILNKCLLWCTLSSMRGETIFIFLTFLWHSDWKMVGALITCWTNEWMDKVFLSCRHLSHHLTCIATGRNEVKLQQTEQSWLGSIFIDTNLCHLSARKSQFTHIKLVITAQIIKGGIFECTKGKKRNFMKLTWKAHSGDAKPDVDV